MGADEGVVDLRGSLADPLSRQAPGALQNDLAAATQGQLGCNDRDESTGI
jgi:hypothetical protein